MLFEHCKQYLNADLTFKDSVMSAPRRLDAVTEAQPTKSCLYYAFFFVVPSYSCNG